MYFEDKQT